LSKRTLLMGVTTLCVLAAIVCVAAQKEMNVEVKEAQIRSTPSPLGTVVGTAKAGNALKVNSEQGDWYNVTTTDGATTGWVRKSSVTKSKVKMSAGENDVAGVSSTEMSQATKGFTKEVEVEYEKRNGDLKQYFDEINRVEKIKTSASEMLKFLKDGGIKAGAQ
jgi:hypothetical protein